MLQTGSKNRASASLLRSNQPCGASVSISKQHSVASRNGGAHTDRRHDLANAAIAASRVGTVQLARRMRLSVDSRADESLVSERMCPVFDWQTFGPVDHLVVRRDGGGHMGRLSSALNFGMTSVDHRPDNRDHGYDAPPQPR